MASRNASIWKRGGDMQDKAYLILADGRVFEGRAFGAAGEVTGELVFTTAMTGYLETLTDPSYFGQIVVQTFPLIGNYGVIPTDFESDKPRVRAYIVREWCREPSNFRCEGDLDTFLLQNGIVGLCGIDTRALTRIVREKGVMNAKIVRELPADKEAVQSELADYEIREAVAGVTCDRIHEVGSGSRHVVLYDFGAKNNIVRELVKRDCRVTIVPAQTSMEQAIALKPDGIMLSNGPGDPAENVEIIGEIAKLRRCGIPIFGICLGHQLLALAAGARTEKLKYGHRGVNQPVRDCETGRVYITSQNHGYAVVSDTLPACAKERFANANDGTCEGIDYADAPVFSVQFHPEACGGPLDTRFLFDRFVAMMKGEMRYAVK